MRIPSQNVIIVYNAKSYRRGGLDMFDILHNFLKKFYPEAVQENDANARWMTVAILLDLAFLLFALSLGN